MDPIQAPHDIGRKMNRRSLAPILIDVVAHLLNEFGDKMCTDGLVFAAFDLHACRPEVAGVGANTAQGFAL